jgi:UDP-N-acetyl-D-mannosaminuronic acid dehydrogenase
LTTVCVVGLGHVGLPTAALLADAGCDVTGCDIAPAVVAGVNEGRAHIHEEGLEALLARVVHAGRLRAAAAPVPADFHIIAVPTPLAPGNRADLSAVEAACDAVAPMLRKGDTVVLESTVPPGTTAALAGRFLSVRPDLAMPAPGRAGDVCIAHVPERVLPGHALHELVHNDRVIGGLGPDCAARAKDLYARFVRGALLPAEARLAEVVKLAENAFRDVNIAFANELAAVCARLGVDARETIALANRHPRVNVLTPGIGVGGHCVAVDPWFLVQAAPEETPLIRAARAVNDATPLRVVAQVRAACAGLAAPRIACLGLAYKPDVADCRESPAVAVVRALLDAGFSVTASDPFVRAVPGLDVPLLDAAAAIAAADVVAVLVAHTPFRALDGALLAGKVVVDCVGMTTFSRARTGEGASKASG